MKPVDDSWLFRTTTLEQQHEGRKKNFAAKASFGEPYDMADLRRALDDDREERAAKRQAAEEAKRKAEQEEFRLTADAMPLTVKAKQHAAKEPEPVVKLEIEVGPICTCRSFRYPHFLDAHEQLESQWDWRTPDEREAEERARYQRLRAGDPGRKNAADRVRDEKDRRPGFPERKTG